MSNNEISFFIPLKKVPTTTHQMKRVAIQKGKPIFYEDEKLKSVRSLFIGHLAKYAPKEKLKGAIQLHVMWLFKETKKNKSGDFKITKPDTDNLNKLLKDCMTTCKFWNDDAQVAVEHIEKRYNDIPGILITINQLGGNDDPNQA